MDQTQLTKRPKFAKHLDRNGPGPFYAGRMDYLSAKRSRAFPTTDPNVDPTFTIRS